MVQDTSSAPFRFEGWELRPVERVLLVRGEPVRIGSRAFDVLLALIGRRGQLISRTELLDLAWPGLVVEENNISVQISTLRKLLGSEVVATLPGLGYRLSAQLLEEDVAPPALGAEASTPSLKDAARQASVLSGVAVAGNLPATLPLLFGREADITALLGMVRAHRLVSVLGAGGIGKTRLAQAVAYRLQDEYAAGAWMVELAPVNDPALLPVAIAQAMGMTLPGQRSAQEEVISMLRVAPAMLVLDNCEHLVEAASAFAQAISESTRHVHLLCTSQERLNLPGEQVYRTPTLAVPVDGSLTAAAGSAAVSLLVSRVAAQRPGFALDRDNVGQAADICRRLDGLPLAIELAAARVPVLGLAGVRERLDERLRMLVGGSRTGPRRHRTLRETLDWSHGLLEAAEAAVFRRAGVFMGGFGLAQAEQVLVDGGLDVWAVLDHLGALVDKSLILVETVDPPRYRLLESARAFALEKLREADEVEQVRGRHAQATLAMFEASVARQWDLPSQQRVNELLPDIDNCRAALEWAADGPAPLHIALAGAAAWLFGATGQSVEGRRHCEQALNRLDADIPPYQEARLQFAWCGLAHYLAGNHKRQAAERAVALYRRIDDSRGLYAALGRWAITASLGGDGKAGDLATREMESLWKPSWGPLSRWDLLNARDYVANMLGRFDEGEAIAQEELALATENRDAAKTMFALMALEQCAATRGDYAEAVRRGRELLARARQERYVERLQVYTGNLATALVMVDELQEALVVAREAAELDRRAGTLWLSLDLFSMLALKRGRVADAAVVMGRSDAANAWRGTFREPVEQRVRDAVAHALQHQLVSAELAELLSRGAGLNDEEAAALALRD